MRLLAFLHIFFVFGILQAFWSQTLPLLLVVSLVARLVQVLLVVQRTRCDRVKVPRDVIVSRGALHSVYFCGERRDNLRHCGFPDVFPASRSTVLETWLHTHVGVSENSVPLNPMVDDHYPY